MSPQDELRSLLDRLPDRERTAVMQLASQLAGGHQARTDLIEALHTMNDEQIDKILTVAHGVQRPIEEQINPDSDILTPTFTAEFRSRIQIHHATHTTPLDRTVFEDAFLSASETAGFNVSRAPSKTTRFWDVTVEGKQISLKTEAAKSMRSEWLHISKLSEAAWIQDCRTAKCRRDNTLQLFRTFLAAVHRIFVLRIRRDPPVHYELVEVPTRLFALVGQLQLTDFASEAPSIPVPPVGYAMYILKLDRSDAKITIARLLKVHCVVHGTWDLAQS
jgi:hypothetical protein